MKVNRQKIRRDRKKRRVLTRVRNVADRLRGIKPNPTKKPLWEWHPDGIRATK